jgi:hypothetical protein
VEYLYKDKIDTLLNNKKILHQHNLINNMVDLFYNETISTNDKKLLELAFKKELTQKDLNDFIVNWDIEVYGGSKALMLAYIMKDNKHLEFSAYEGPRLSGLLNYYRFLNLKVIAHFTKITRELNKNQITPLLIKGGAMKHIRPDLPRVMGDTDIVTIGKDFETACEIAKKLGYEFGMDSDFHSADLHIAGEQHGAVDIHRFIDFETKYDKSFMNELFKRGTKVKAFGADVILPSAEDMVFIGLSNLAKNLHNKTSSAGMLYVLFDCKYLIETKKDFDWNIILENSYKTNSSVAIYFAIKFLNKIVPNILQEEIFETKKVSKDLKNYCNKVIFFRFHIHDLKMECKKLKIKNALTNFDTFKKYLTKKPKHFILKRLKKSTILVTIFLKIFNTQGKQL